jgi:Helix-turn-helix domain
LLIYVLINPLKIINCENEKMWVMEKLLRKQTEETYPHKIFASQLITVDDLFQFKKELLDELVIALKPQPSLPGKKWMKSHEVRRMLKISPGTLQTLKSSGTIPYTKIGGVHFYDYEDIERILKDGKTNSGKCCNC